MSAQQPQSTATPSPIPIRVSHFTDDPMIPGGSEQDISSSDLGKNKKPASTDAELPKPQADLGSINTRPIPIPSHDDLKVPSLAHKARLRIHFEDLTQSAVAKFLAVMPISTLLQTAISNVQAHLFTPSEKQSTSAIPPHPPQTTPNPTAIFLTSTTTPIGIHSPAAAVASPPPPQHPLPKPTPPTHYQPQEVRSITLVLRPMDGVAYTTGTNLDPSHKEIHLNTGYIEAIMNSTSQNPNPDKRDSLFEYELTGVITHEMVHAFQHNAYSTCPGGLIEGIADYVRLKSGLGAKHWEAWPASTKTRGDKWDEGYQRTAWFLGWVEREAQNKDKMDKGGKGRDGHGDRDVIQRLNFEMRRRKWEDGKVWRDVMGESVEESWKRYVDDWEDMNRRHEKEEDKAESEGNGDELLG